MLFIAFLETLTMAIGLVDCVNQCKALGYRRVNMVRQNSSNTTRGWDWIVDDIIPECIVGIAEKPKSP